MPYPGLLNPEPLPLWQATADSYFRRRHSYTVLAQSLWGVWVLGCTGFVWALWVSLGRMGFDSKNDFAPPIILLWVFLCPWMWSIFFWWHPTFSCQSCSAVSYYFGVLTGEDELTSFYSAILETQPQKIWDSSHFPLSSAFPTWKLHLPWIHPWLSFIFYSTIASADYMTNITSLATLNLIWMCVI